MEQEIQRPAWLARNARTLFAALFGLALLEIANALFRFAFVYTDSDQTLIWTAAKDIAHGHFHGFCFYGQSYNPLIEPLFATPFLWMGLKASIALPLVTTLLGTVPYLLIAWVFYKKYGAYTALVPLVIFLLLPPEFLMTASMPRGFVAGVFFTVIGLLLFIYKPGRWSLIVAGFCLGLGLFANPNGVLLFPLAIPVLFDKTGQFTNRLFYSFFGFCIGLIPLVINHYYYAHRPEMVFHPAPGATFSMHTLREVLGSLDDYFDFISPVFWRAGWISLFLFVIIAVVLIAKKQKIKFYTVIILLFSILVSFAFDKVGDSTNSIYFPGSRFFMAYPVMLVFIISWGFVVLSSRQKNVFLSVSLIMACLAFCIKIMAFHTFLGIDLRPSKDRIVQVMEVSGLREYCSEIQYFSKEKPDLVIGAADPRIDKIIAYGCPCMEKDFPPDILLDYERRTWLLPQMADKVYPKVLIYGLDSAAWIKLNKRMPDIIKEDKKKGYLFINNKRKTSDLIDKIGWSR